MNLNQIQQLCNDATPGPWTAPPSTFLTDDIIQGPNGERVAGSCCCGGFTKPQDEAFTMAARTLVPLLLKVAKEAKASAPLVVCDQHAGDGKREKHCKRCRLDYALAALVSK